MAKSDDIWEMERRCWTHGKSFYDQIITEDSIYAFPPPMGIFKGADFVESLSEEGPCKNVEMSDCHERLIDDVAVLVYSAVGHARDGSFRKAHCSTIWQKTQDGWKLQAHHQTPLA